MATIQVVIYTYIKMKTEEFLKMYMEIYEIIGSPKKKKQKKEEAHTIQSPTLSKNDVWCICVEHCDT